MEIIQLKYFQTLARNEHLLRTAEEMHVTPSAISISMAKLEKELDVPLFERAGRGMRITQYGKCLLPYVDTILATIEEAQQACESMSTRMGLTVTVAFDDSVFFGQLFDQFQRENLTIQLVQIPGNMVSQDVILREYEANFFCTSVDMADVSGWDRILLYEDRIVLAVPPGHPLVGRKEVSLTELKDERFLFRSKGDFFQRYIDELLNVYRFIAKHQIECNYALRPQILHSSNENVVFSTLLAVKGAVPTVYAPGTQVLAIREFRHERYPKFLCWRCDQELSPAMLLFRNFFMNYTDGWAKRVIREVGYPYE